MDEFAWLRGVTTEELREKLAFSQRHAAELAAKIADPAARPLWREYWAGAHHSHTLFQSALRAEIERRQ